MRLTSVNVGSVQPIQRAKSSGVTGIYKLPTLEPVQVTSLGLAGDAICDKKHHGGDDQAVYVYGVDDYAWWSATLGRDLGPGTFGENLTITNLQSARCAIGDRLHIDNVILEVTAPRIPCATLAARMGEPEFVKRFRHAERSGLYCRVIQPGAVQAGNRVRLEPFAGETVGVLEMFREFYQPDESEATLRRYLAAPIAIRDRKVKQARLEKLLHGNTT